MRTLIVLALLGGAAAAKKGDLAGEWTLTLERPGMQPRMCTGTLVLAHDGRRWTGTLAFDTILFARPHALSDVKVRGRRVWFAIAHERFTLEFTGRLRDGGVSGECDWKRLGSYKWTAVRRKAAAEGVARFEDGLVFDDGMPRGEAEELAVDGDALDRLVLAAERAHTDGLVVVKDGQIVAERYFKNRRGRVHVMSIAKFFATMAVAHLVEDGKIASLDAPVSTWFPAWKEGRRGRVTVRHLLNHTSGIRHPRLAHALNKARDKVAYVLEHPVETEPGAAFSYNNDAFALLSGVIQKAAGRPCDDLLDEKLFRPLGIEDWAWDRDAAGRTITYAQLALTARDLAKVGVMIAQGGVWQGKQVFPKAWIDTLAGRPGSAHSEACGLGWWRGDDPAAIYHTGWLGQWLLIHPERGIVAARLRQNDGSEAPNRNLSPLPRLLSDLTVG